MPTRFPIVLVVWEDSEHDGAWSDVADEAEHKLGICTSVGWLVHENEQRIVLAASISETEIGNKTYIPPKIIVKRKVLKKAKALPKPKSVRIPKGDGSRDNKSTEPVDRVGKVTVDKPTD